MISEAKKEKLRTLTVELMLEMRQAYLRTPGANQLKNWEILQSRMRGAARTTASPEEWASKIQVGLQVPSINNSYSKALIDLVHLTSEDNCQPEWLDLIEREHGLLIAMARLIVEERKAAK